MGGQDHGERKRKLNTENRADSDVQEEKNWRFKGAEGWKTLNSADNERPETSAVKKFFQA